MCVHDAWGIQMGTSDFQGLKLQMLVSPYVCSGNQALIFLDSILYSEALSNLSIPLYILKITKMHSGELFSVFRWDLYAISWVAKPSACLLMQQPWAVDWEQNTS